MRSNLLNFRIAAAIAMCCSMSIVTGCKSSIPTEALIPAQEVLNAACCKPDTTQQINFLSLRQSPPEEYTLGKGDTLGIYIQGVTGDKDTPPPVNFPDDPGAQPGLGYPVPIRDDGYISLPLVAPIRVTGLTLADAERRIADAYTKDKEILLEGNEKIIVTLMQRRTYNILVIREDVESGNPLNSLNRNQVYIPQGGTNETSSIQLPAGENDVLHALSETGGMPGERARNEIVIFRGGQSGNVDSLVQEVNAPVGQQGMGIDQAKIVRIPIEAEQGQFPNLTEEDITLYDGDVVYIKGREEEVFYTGGMLEGGRFPLPRDYKIDVLEAIAIAGGSVSGSAGSSGIGRTSSILPATQVTVLRKCGCEQTAIDVDLRYALADPSERVIIQPGDLIILEFRKRELITNTIAQAFTFGGVFNLFR